MNDVKLIGEISDIYEIAQYNMVDYAKAELKIEKMYNGKTYIDFIPLSLRGENVAKIQNFGVGVRVIVSGSLSRREYIEKDTREVKKSKTEVSVFGIEAIAS